jgi:hypothetical protein
MLQKFRIKNYNAIYLYKMQKADQFDRLFYLFLLRLFLHVHYFLHQFDCAWHIGQVSAH